MTNYEKWKAAMEWECHPVNKCYVEKITSKAVLIRMPNHSDYAGYYFWHPRKCFKERPGTFGEEYDLYYKDNGWMFTLKANGGALVVELDGSTWNDALPGTGFSRYEEKSDKHVPLPMDPVEIEADEELIDDED